jgi:ATP-dependent Clp protease ATP-binding subunit ClpC
MTRVKKQMGVKGLDLELTDRLKSWLAEKGYDPQLGARPLRRTIQRELEDVLSERLLTGEFHADQLIVADLSEDGTTVEFRAVDAPSAPDTPPVELAGGGGPEERPVADVD